jgi:hypothetical protein
MVNYYCDMLQHRAHTRAPLIEKTGAPKKGAPKKGAKQPKFVWKQAMQTALNA